MDIVCDRLEGDEFGKQVEHFPCAEGTTSVVSQRALCLAWRKERGRTLKAMLQRFAFDRVILVPDVPNFECSVTSSSEQVLAEHEARFRRQDDFVVSLPFVHELEAAVPALDRPVRRARVQMVPDRSEIQDVE